MRTREAAVAALASPLFLLLVFAFASCEDSSGTSPGGTDFEAGGGFMNDASTGSFSDATQDDAVADVGVDGADADAGPFFDEAGCPLPSGVVGNLADAGFTTTGLALWLRADLGVATTDAGVVCRWDDVSGHNRAFVPGTLTPPSVEAAGLVGKPAVAFTGENQQMIRNDVLGLAATSGRTVAAFVQNSDLTTRFQLFQQAKLGTAGTFFGLDANTFDTAGSREGVYVTNNSFDSDLATSTSPRAHILSISSFAPGGALPDVLVYEVDGTARTLARNPGGLGTGVVEDFTAADLTYIGGANAGFLGAKLGEILVWDHALTVPERLAVEQYFQRRY